MGAKSYRKRIGQFALTACAVAAMATSTPSQASTPFSGVDSSSKFLVYYGNDFSTANLNAMSAFKVVVLGDPANTGVTPANVAYLQNHGVTYVLGYISIGEDVASTQNGASLIVGDGTGPVYMDSSNVLHYENKGIASFYVDEWTPSTPPNPPTPGSDTHADTNWNFNGYFIWPNAAWRTILNTETYSATAGVRSCVGLAKLMGTRTNDTDTNRGDNFGFNGVFLDTLDTAGPYDGQPGYYSWAAQEMSNTVSYIHTTYPTKMVLANRGMAFYDPDVTSSVHHIHPYDYDIRPFVNGTLMESYHLDSTAGNTGINPNWNDNFLNYGRKVSAEGNRPDGFTIFCLDYQCGRATALYDEGIRYAITDNGWTYYQAGTGALNDVNTYVSTHMPAADTAAPAWSTAHTPSYVAGSNYTDTSNPYPALPGIQSIFGGSTSGDVTAQWDLALDQTGPIKYTIYQSADAAFTGATVYPNVNYSVGATWPTGASTNNANQYTIPGVVPGTFYYRVRATDVLSHQDTNSSTLSYTVLPGQISNPVQDGAIVANGSLSDWSTLRSFGVKPVDLTGAANPVVWTSGYMANDTNYMYIAFNNATTVSGLSAAQRIFLDTDANRATGYIGGGSTFPIGAEYMIEGTKIYKFSGGGQTTWGWTEIVGGLGYSYGGTCAEYFFARSNIGNSKNINFFFYGDNSGTGGSLDYYPMNANTATGGYCAYKLVDASNPVSSTAITVNGSLTDWSTLTSFGTKASDVSGASNPVNWQVAYAAHDSTNLYFAITNYNAIGTLDAKYNIYIDTDSNPSTGFRGGSGNFPVGAEYLVQGSSILKYMGTGTNWLWGNGTTQGVPVGTFTPSVSGNSAEFKFARSLIGSPKIVRLYFYGDNTGLGGVIDSYPSGALTSNATGNFLVYRMDDVNNTVAAGAITVNGSLTDWSTLRPFPVKPDDVTGASNPADYEQGWVAQDPTNLYFAFRNANTITLNGAYNIFIDTDCNRSTGFIGTGSTLSVGAEYMIQGGSLFHYTGTGTTWSWSPVAGATSGASGNTAEIGITRASIGSPAIFKFMMYGDNPSVGGTTVDAYPIGSNSGASGTSYTYRVN